MKRVFLFLLFLNAFSQLACATSSAVLPRQTATLAFNITPGDLSHIVIYVDDRYYGELDSWVDRVVRLDAGDRRVKLEAKGYIPQRFDFTLKPGQHLTFSLSLEPDIEELDSAEPLVTRAGGSAHPLVPRSSSKGLLPSIPHREDFLP